jgi:hypothetical protein
VLGLVRIVAVKIVVVRLWPEFVYLLHAQLLHERLLFILGTVEQLEEAPTCISIELNHNLEII